MIVLAISFHTKFLEGLRSSVQFLRFQRELCNARRVKGEAYVILV